MSRTFVGSVHWLRVKRENGPGLEVSLRDVIGKLSELDSRKESRAEGVHPGRVGPLLS